MDWMDGSRDGWEDGLGWVGLDSSMDGWVDEWMNEWLRMNEWMNRMDSGKQIDLFVLSFQLAASE